MSTESHAIWMLCGLGAVVWAALPSGAGLVARAAAAAAAFALAVAWALLVAPLGAVGLGSLVAVVGGIHVLTGRWHSVAPALAGFLAGAWATHVAAAGVPWWFAVPATMSVPATGAILARRDGFAPQTLLEDALLILAGLGLVVAIIPGVGEGWRAALSLNLPAHGESTAQPIPTWAISIGGSALALGGVYRVWSRR